MFAFLKRAVLVSLLMSLPAQGAVAATPGGSYPTSAESFVRATSPTDAEIAGASSQELLELFVRCVPVPSGQTYCMHLGWPTGGAIDPADLSATLAEAAKMTEASAPGGVALVVEIRSLARQPASARLASELAEVRNAVALAPLVAVDEMGTSATASVIASHAGAEPDFPIPPCSPDPCPPDAMTIMSWAGQGGEQTQLYYCGPASTSMAAKWNGVSHTQDWWWPYVKVAGQNQASLDRIVSALNVQGQYQTEKPFYIKYFTAGQGSQYLATVVNKIYYYEEPLISHVMLYRQYFPYLTHDAGGHYQVIRGYDLYPGGVYNPKIKIFEPWNEATWYHNGNTTSGAQSVSDLNMFNATMANYHQLGA